MYFSISTRTVVSIFCREPYHSDYDSINGRITGNRRPYPDIFQRSIKYPRVHELCQTHFIVEALLVDTIYKVFYCYCIFHNALD